MRFIVIVFLCSLAFASDSLAVQYTQIVNAPSICSPSGTIIGSITRNTEIFADYINFNITSGVQAGKGGYLCTRAGNGSSTPYYNTYSAAPLTFYPSDTFLPNQVVYSYNSAISAFASPPDPEHVVLNNRILALTSPASVSFTNISSKVQKHEEVFMEPSILTQTVSFLIGSFCAMAFVLASKAGY